MIEIIKEGNTPKYQVKCLKCNSILQFTNKDEQHTGYYSMEVGVCKDYYIKCPVCESKIPTRSYSEKEGHTWRKEVYNV